MYTCLFIALNLSSHELEQKETNKTTIINMMDNKNKKKLKFGSYNCKHFGVDKFWC